MPRLPRNRRLRYVRCPRQWCRRVVREIEGAVAEHCLPRRRAKQWPHRMLDEPEWCTGSGEAVVGES